MFAKTTAVFTAFTALAILAVASPTPQAGSCSTGALQCCNSVQSADSLGIAPILAAIGVILQDINIPIGVTCSPISVVGVGSGNACSSNAVCCENNSFGGLLSIGCLPAIL
ncbi:fungal hydrophobin [Trametes versicolor FP-101664 SS1]|uniref:fungal hydrophobin n=1 Tax=Trametes versicolor (strain FP-101664) TaxID=717944 RepID=UPI0004623CFE|nr:fungal hydrophobin [Trametes versicolor FP-101664 SS1]EIW52215.1 fungal hydrophobin [Trametes versicolor FP-101664 SS1]